LFDIACHEAMFLLKTEQVSGGTVSERSVSNDSRSRSKADTQIKRMMKRQSSAGNYVMNIKQAVVES